MNHKGQRSNQLMKAAACLVLGFTIPMLGTMALSGCTGNKPQASQENTDFDLKVLEVRQLDRLGKKMADGQYLVLTLGIRNNTPADRSIAYNAMQLVFEDKQSGESYSQPPEASAKLDFLKAYGLQEAEKLLKGPEEVFHPKVEAIRYLVFMVPQDAKLNQYTVQFKPVPAAAFVGGGGAAINLTPISIPVVTSQTKLVDLREDPTHSTASS